LPCTSPVFDSRLRHLFCLFAGQLGWIAVLLNVVVS
jgi:hypothetical protein